MLKIEDVKTGDELECVDHKGFASGKRAVNEPILEMKEIIVQSISSKNLIYVHDKNNSDNFFIYESELKYFKKKEQSQQYTFDDLIDVATKAFKDRAIFSVGITICAVSIKLHDKSEEVFTIADIDEGIEFIQSLYKETFVIESHEDIRRIKNDANITLSNGNRIEQAVHENRDDYIVFNDSSDDVYTFNFMVLKGATVEQERGRDD